MEIIRNNIWLCQDCMLFAVNGDLPPDTNEQRDTEIAGGVYDLGRHLVPDFGNQPDDLACSHSSGEEEFSTCQCDACKTNLAGARYRFAILGDE